MQFNVSIVALALLSTALVAPPPLRLLVVTGGHDYPTSFYTVFEQDGLTWDHAVSNEEAFKKDLRGRYDALVLYDMSATISPEAQTHFREFVEKRRRARRAAPRYRQLSGFRLVSRPDRRAVLPGGVRATIRRPRICTTST